MPAVRGVSGFMAKYGDEVLAAHEEHKDSEVEFNNFGEIPPNVEGIARLENCEVKQIGEGKQNAGEYIFFANGIALTPETAMDANDTEVKVRGKRTSIIENLFPTPGKTRESISDHIRWVYNEFKKFGLDLNDFNPKDPTYLDQACAALTEAAPTFRFRTWRGSPTPAYPNPRTNHEWLGVCEFNDPDGPADVEDGSGQAPAKTAPRPSTNGHSTAVAAGPKAAPKPAPAPAPKPAPKPAPAPAKPAPKPAPTPAPKPGPKPAPAKAAAPAPAARPGPKPKAAPAPEPEEGGEGNDPIPFDLDDLAKRSDAKKPDEGAQYELNQIANQYGVTDEQISGSSSWAEVADMIRAAMTEPAGDDGDVPPEGEGEGEAGAGEEAVWVPNAGEVYLYKPLDPKTKKPGKAVEVEIDAVHVASEQVDFHSLDDGKKWAKVKWSALEQGE